MKLPIKSAIKRGVRRQIKKGATSAALVAPTVLTAPEIGNSTGGAWEKSALYRVPAVWENAESVEGAWYTGETLIPSSEEALSWLRDEFDLANQGNLTYRETATSADGLQTVAISNELPPTIAGLFFWVNFGLTEAYTDRPGVDPKRSVPLGLQTGATNPDTYNVFMLKTPELESGAAVPAGAASVGAGGQYKVKIAGNVGTDLATNGTSTGLAPCMGGFMSFNLGNKFFVGAVKAGVEIVLQVGFMPNSNSPQNYGYYDGDKHANVAVSAVENHTSTTNVGGGTEVMGALEDRTAPANWIAQTGKRLVTVTDRGGGEGYISIGRHGGGTNGQFRSAKAGYKEMFVNLLSSNLADNTVYIDKDGSNVTGLGTIAAPFKNLPGDVPGGGIIGGFSLTPGSYALFQGGETHRAAGTTGHNGRVIHAAHAGTAGNPVTLGSYGTGKGMIDGTEPLVGWRAVNSGDGTAWLNPNAANLEIFNGGALSAGEGALRQNGEPMFLCQWPCPTNPADGNMTYVGNDSFIALHNDEWDAQVIEQYTVECGADGGAGTGWYKQIITSPDLLAHYATDNIDVTDEPSVRLIGRITGNRLGKFPIVAHNPATGYMEFLVEKSAGSQTTLFDPHDSSEPFLFAIRGHPYDIAIEGQYAYMGGVPVGHFLYADRSRINPLFAWGYGPGVNYHGLDNLILQNVGQLSSDPLVGTGAVVDSGSALRVGMFLTDVEVRFAQSDNVLMPFKALNGGVASDWTLTDVYVHDVECDRVVQWDCDGEINGLEITNANATAAVFQRTPIAPVTHTGLNFHDALGIHANGPAVYLKASNITYVQCHGTNLGIPKSTQQDGTVASRNITWDTGLWQGRRGFDGNPSPTLSAWQFLGGETDMLAHHEVFFAAVTYGSSASGGPDPSTGSVLRNECFSSFKPLGPVDLTRMAGLHFENNCFHNWDGGVAVLSDSDITSRGGTVGVGAKANIYVPAAGTFQGYMSDEMHQAFTADGLGGYVAHDLGLPGQPWVIPAYGDTIVQQDLWLSATRVRRRWRGGLDFATIKGNMPMEALSLTPGGLLDNALVQINANYISFIDTAVAGVYQFSLRGTHPVAGTHDTVVTVTVY